MATITSQQKHSVLTKEVSYTEKCPNQGLLKVMTVISNKEHNLRTETLGKSPVSGWSGGQQQSTAHTPSFQLMADPATQFLSQS